MSLLSRLANREVLNFLRTTTLKCSYFADRSRETQLRNGMNELVPDIELPYVKHVAGEYILKSVPTDYDKDGKELGYKNVTNPMTGEVVSQVYENTTILYDRDGERTNKQYNANVFYSNALDEMMYVTSLDTGEVIPFTLENLHSEFAVAAGYDANSVHTKTLAAYKLPSRYYDLLCERYPNQKDLIKAIVYPVPARDYTADELANYQTAGTPLPSLSVRRRDRIVSAANLDILNYDDTLLEENERVSLTSQMKAFLNIIKDRWDIPTFVYEENYAVTLWGVVWSLLPMCLIAQRYANIKTPFAHTMHIWDYLTSKGLEEYKGYLTTEQTLWLYKNIVYLEQHRGKQKITNLLIDELLEEANLDIEAKTIVLDTTDTLKDPYEPTSKTMQCSQCSRRHTCNKGTKDYLCPWFLGLDKLCKAEPIVLTEEFAGASRKKILRTLVTQYGYTEEEAVEKYDRSFIWRDEQIDEIRNNYNRDQLVDLSGSTESLDDLIFREYHSQLEPKYDEDVVEEQEKELRHVAGTYAPTKLLEMTEKVYNVRFTELFNKFFTDSLLRMAPRKNAAGLVVSKVNDSYKFAIKNSTNTYILGFGEMIAALYLGTTREYFEEFTRTICYKVATGEHPDSSTQYYHKDSAQNYVMSPWDYVISGWGVVPFYVKDSNAILTNILGCELSPEAKAALAGDDGPTFKYPIPTQSRVTMAFKYGKPVKQQDLILAYGQGVTSGPMYEKVTNRCETMKICRIRDTYYAAAYSAFSPGGVAEDPTIWEDAGFSSLTILGQFLSNGSYVENDKEIPIIPTYFRWYNEHLNVSRIMTKDVKVEDDKTYYMLNSDGEYVEVELTKKDEEGNTIVVYDKNIVIPCLMGWYEDVNLTPETDQTTILNMKSGVTSKGVAYGPLDTTITSKTGETMTVVGHVRVDDSVPQLADMLERRRTIKREYDLEKSKVYQKCLMSSIVDVDNLIDNYVDIMGSIGRQDAVGNYLTKMFRIFEGLLISALGSVSTRTQTGIKVLVDTLMVKKLTDFELTSAPKNSTFKTIVDSRGNLIPVATYQDWLDTNEDLASAINGIVGSSDEISLWNEFNARVVDKLVEGCSLSYAAASTDTTRFEKLKQLIRNLSSYKVAFINTAAGTRDIDTTTPIIVDESSSTSNGAARLFFDPIGDNADRCHVTSQLLSDKGDLYVLTTDEYVVSGKIYYTLDNHAEMIEASVDKEPLIKSIENKIVHVFDRVDTTSPTAKYHPQRWVVDKESGERYQEPASLIPTSTFYEKVNIYKLLPGSHIYRENETLELKRSELMNWLWRIGINYQAPFPVPANLADGAVAVLDDPFLPFSYITSIVKDKLKAPRYVKYIDKMNYVWSPFKKDVPEDPSAPIKSFTNEDYFEVEDVTTGKKKRMRIRWGLSNEMNDPRGPITQYLDVTMATVSTHSSTVHSNMDKLFETEVI